MSTQAPPPTPTPTPPPSDQPRRLTRSSSDRVIGGVAGGLGRYFGVDPVVFRIGIAAAAFAGGIGVFVYVAALLFVPDEEGSPTLFDRHRALTIAGTVLLGIAVLSAIDGDAFWGPIVPIALLAVFGYAVLRALKREDSGGPVTLRRVFRWAGVGLGAVAGLSVLAVGAASAAAEGSGAAIAGIVIAIGAALLISALRPGGARWLALPALALAVPLGVVSAADVSFKGGFGEKTYQPASLAAVAHGGYRLGAGQLRVDLRNVRFPPGQETVVDVGIGTGRVEVLVPEGVCATTDARVGGGYVNVRGRDAGGLDMDFDVRASSVAPRVLIRGNVGLGVLEVVDRPEDAATAQGDHNGGAGPVRDGACTRVETAQAG